MAFTSQRIAGLRGLSLPDMGADDMYSLLNSDVNMPIRLTVSMTGHLEAAKYLRALPGAIRSTAGRGALNAARAVVVDARKRVPYDTGDTYNSIRIQTSKESGKLTLHDVVADTAYAWFIHENNLAFLQRDRAPQQPVTPYTRQWKFLEDAGTHVMKSYQDIMADQVNALIAVAKAEAERAGVPQRGGPPRLVKGGSKSLPAPVFSKPLTDNTVKRGIDRDEIQEMFRELSSAEDTD